MKVTIFLCCSDAKNNILVVVDADVNAVKCNTMKLNNITGKNMNRKKRKIKNIIIFLVVGTVAVVVRFFFVVVSSQF
jgi:hypothetical protein